MSALPITELFPGLEDSPAADYDEVGWDRAAQSFFARMGRDDEGYPIEWLGSGSPGNEYATAESLVQELHKLYALQGHTQADLGVSPGGLMRLKELARSGVDSASPRVMRDSLHPERAPRHFEPQPAALS